VLTSGHIAKVVDDDFRWAKDATIATVTPLDDLKYYMVGLRSIASNRDGVVILWIEWLPYTLFRFDLMSA
jgi:hypothetical protein